MGKYKKNITWCMKKNDTMFMKHKCPSLHKEMLA